METERKKGQNNLAELYAVPIKSHQRQRAPSVTSNFSSEGIYDRLDRQDGRNGKFAAKSSDDKDSPYHSASPPESLNEKQGSQNRPRMPTESLNDRPEAITNGDNGSVISPPRSLEGQSGGSNFSEDLTMYENPVGILETKDTNDVVRELKKLGLERQSDRIVSCLKNRFELEAEFIEICNSDGVVIVEGDSDDSVNEHQSIGGLRVKGMKVKCVNYDEYDPDIIQRCGQAAKSREKMANDAAILRRHAANMLWRVENMERMIDPNSRVRYVRHEGGE